MDTSLYLTTRTWWDMSVPSGGSPLTARPDSWPCCWTLPGPGIHADVDAAAAVFVGDNQVPDYLGPERAGITSYLIDPTGSAPVADHRRLETIFDLPGRLQEPG